MMQESIMRKGNLLAPELDKLIHPIFKYEKDLATEMLISLMKMILRLYKCPQSWGKGKSQCFPSQFLKKKR
jgi:hypothetical protein